MKNFPYDPRSITDCIIDTESQLRDLISTILSSKYGSTWDTGEHGFPPELIEQLKERRNQEKGNFPSRKASDRLIDYSYVLDLNKLIERNWDDFNSIFTSRSRICFLLDELIKYRNPIIHSRSTISTDQIYYVLGICGEILRSIDNWHSGLKHLPSSFQVGLRFELPKSNEIESNGIQAKELVENWVNETEENLSAKFEIKESNQNFVSGLLRLPQGHLKISYSWNHQGNRGGSYFRYANLDLETTNLNALDEVLKVGNQPYWFIRYKYKIDLDVALIHEKVKNVTGITSQGSGSVKYGDGPTMLTQINYNLLGTLLRVSLDRGNSYEGTITLVYNTDSYNKGFWNAHEYLRPDVLLSHLYGFITPAELKKCLDMAVERKN